MKLCESEYQIGGHIEQNNRQFKVPHHGVMDFIKAIMRDIEPRGMNLKYKFIA
jgi:hypothetical protein